MIYKLSYENNVYIGCTNKELQQRLYSHLKNYNYYLKTKKCFCTSYLLFEKSNNIKIELLEQLNKDISKKDMLLKEGYYIKKFMDDKNYNVLNKKIEGRTTEEYRRDNKTIIEQQAKEYYLKNKSNISSIKKQKLICLHCNKTFNKSNKYKHVKVCSDNNIIIFENNNIET